MAPSTGFFEAFRRLNVLVVGDIMIDRYLSGTVDRISPEAPVPVVHLRTRDSRLGGAANVALNLSALGAKPYLCSVVGEDENGEQVRALLPEAGLSARGLVRSAERLTTVKTRVLAASQQLLRVDQEDTHDLSAREAGQFLNTVRSLLEQRDIHAILFQDYNKGVLSEAVIREVILEAIKRDIPTVVDPKYRNFWAYKRSTLFKPNLKEIRAQVPMPVEPTLESLLEANAYIHRKLENPITLITLSDKGLFISDQKEHYLLPTEPRAIADVCGAGDTVVSVAALGLAQQLPIREIAALANLAGGQVCERVGVVPVNKNQLMEEFQAWMAREQVKG